MRNFDYKPPVTIESLAAELRRLRRERGLTQPQLAERMGIAVSTVTHIERARRQPGLDILRLWLEACGAALTITRVDAADPTAAVSTAVRELDDAQRDLVRRLVAVVAALPTMDATREVRLLEIRAGLAPMPELPASVKEPEVRFGRRDAG